MYRTVKVYDSDLKISWNPGWEELVKLREMEIGARFPEDFKKRGSSQANYRTVMECLKHISEIAVSLKELIREGRQPEVPRAGFEPIACIEIRGAGHPHKNYGRQLSLFNVLAI